MPAAAALASARAVELGQAEGGDLRKCPGQGEELSLHPGTPGPAQPPPEPLEADSWLVLPGPLAS